MNPAGDNSDPLFVEARRGLIDALLALGPHASSVVLVGAQAIYIHTNEIVTGVALRTKDADLALIPPIDNAPDIDAVMRGASFVPGDQPGIWLDDGRQVDLLVPEALAPRDRHRSARLPGHGHQSFRKVSGIEGAAVDHAPADIRSLDPDDVRAVRAKVAGPAALLVSKAIKLVERAQEPGARRVEPKDAFDSYRLLQLPLMPTVSGFDKMLASEVSAAVTRRAIVGIHELFEGEDSLGTRLAGEYVEGVGDPALVSAAVVDLAQELLAAVERDVSIR